MGTNSTRLGRAERDSRTGDRQGSAATASAARPTRVVAAGTNTKNAGDAHGSIAGARDRGLSHRPSAPRAASFEQIDEASGVGAGIARRGQHGIVAGHLALQRKARIDPPDSGMEEEQSTDGLLEKVGPVVVAAQVRQLMDHDGPQFVGAEIAQRPCGKDNRPGCEIQGPQGRVPFPRPADGSDVSFRRSDSRSVGSSVRRQESRHSFGESAAPARRRRSRGPAPQRRWRSRAMKKATAQKAGRAISGCAWGIRAGRSRCAGSESAQNRQPRPLPRARPARPR